MRYSPFSGEYCNFASLQAGLSLHANAEESPDSTEQCTGEEPAVLPSGNMRDSATENNCRCRNY